MTTTTKGEAERLAGIPTGGLADARRQVREEAIARSKEAAVNPSFGPHAVVGRRRPLRLAALEALATAVLAVQLVPGCGSKPPPPTCPVSSLGSPAAVCVAAAGPTHNDVPHNGLNASALAASRPLLTKLASSQRLDASLIASVGHLLAPSPGGAPINYAPDLLKYIVSCALDPCEWLPLPSGVTFTSAPVERLTGELGLCGKRYRDAVRTNPPERLWRDEPPTPGCLERVSACVLARVNAIESSVVFSMRGDGLGLGDRVPVETKFREDHGTAILSFEPCDAKCTGLDPLVRNCDWEPRSVGQCQRGTRVRLALTHKARARLCAGVHGCDSYAADAGLTTKPVDGLPRYGGRELLPLESGNGYVAFDCPANGPTVEGTPTGYYSVMLAAPPGSGPLPPDADVTLVDEALALRPATTSDAYPAPEIAVFSYREGSFYGTLFGDARLAPGMLSGDQHACYSSQWTAKDAALAHRLCAGPATGPAGVSCFDNPPGPCDPGGVGSKGRCASRQSLVAQPLVAAKCDGIRNDPAGPSTTSWNAPYTSYLNHPCDLYADDQTCLRHLDRTRFPEVMARGPGGIPIRTTDPDSTEPAADSVDR